MTGRWTTLLADLALLLLAGTASPGLSGASGPAAATRDEGAVASFAIEYAPGASESAEAAALPAWLARTRDDGALGLVVTASIDASDRAGGATIALAAARAERLLARLDERRAVEVRLDPDGGRRATVSLRYD